MTSGESVETSETVGHVLKRAGLKVTPEDWARLVRLYPLIERMSQQLRLPEIRYAEPALIYGAASAAPSEAG